VMNESILFYKPNKKMRSALNFLNQTHYNRSRPA
jgi:hypothetical protein